MRNPIINEKNLGIPDVIEIVEDYQESSPIPSVDSDVMTIHGITNKSLISLFFLLLAACLSYIYGEINYQNKIAVCCAMGACVILSFLVSIQKEKAPYFTIPLVLSEGSVLGFISKLAESRSHGIVLEALGVSITTFIVAFIFYELNTKKAKQCLSLDLSNPKFHPKISCSVIPITLSLFYIFEYILSLCGIRIGIFYNSTLFSIPVLVIVCIVVTSNLILNFILIDLAAKSANQKKYMEWYCTFGLMFTLIWSYIDAICLLEKMIKKIIVNWITGFRA